MDLTAVIAQELGIQNPQVERTLALFADGATVPFIARYRKDVTGNLDEAQIRSIEERHTYLTELIERKQTVLDSIESQGKLSPELKARIDASTTKTELEDLYLPYRPKRRTRAMIARERGLEPLADLLWKQEVTEKSLEPLAAPYVDTEKDVPDADAALAGARDIIAERIAEDADNRADVRGISFDEGFIASKVADDWEGKSSKFEMYYDFREKAKEIPSHRYLAIARGVEEGVLRSSLEVPEATITQLLCARTITAPSAITAPFLGEAVEDAYLRLMASSIETDIRGELKDRADGEALQVFQENLKALLLAPPLTGRRVLAMDPGFRTGVKIAAIDETGKYLKNDVIYPVPPFEKVAESRAAILKMIKEYKLGAIAIGNGTASRETDAFVRAFLNENRDLDMLSVVVSESGASVYSASEVAREEFPELDVTVRGAISIGRRLQDPLAELVKIDPKAIGVGQYQHDVNQRRLKKSLDDVVESAVNYVGVEVNTASAALLKHVAGIGGSLAKAIVKHRDESGPFTGRQALMEVPRFGPKAFQQAAGFLRVRDAENPLDNSALHPEQYPVVQRMASDMSLDVSQIIGNAGVLNSIDINKYVEGDIGEYSLKDILEELKKPGRDPRDKFEAITFRSDVTEVEHLEEGMVLEGAVTNVTNFGCFVDIGVHQDGLVHVSRIADRFVKDPNEFVKVGDRVKVRVIGVEVERRRISLSMKESDISGGATSEHSDARGREGAREGGGRRHGEGARHGERSGASGRNNHGGRRGRGDSSRPGDSRSGDRRGARDNRGGASKSSSKSEPFNPAFAALGNLIKK